MTTTVEVAEKSIGELRQAMASGELTAVALVEAYSRRISRYDRKGPRLNSVLELNPDAVSIARALDSERRKTGARGPLHGIPIMLKDNIDTGDRLHTSAGSLALKDSRSAKDAPLVQGLRAAGAVIFGKANMTEWANMMAVGMKGGYSSRGGQVLNPYGADFPVAGSSSGSAVAVAASLCAGSLGTETSGSIISPASQNSVVGIKPTVGLISRTGIIPISATQDTAGPFGRSVADAATILGALTVRDPRDPAMRAAPPRLADYSDVLRDDGLAGARIGVPRKAFWERGLPPVLEVAERAVTRLVDAGAKVVDPADLKDADATRDLGMDVLVYEFKRDLNRYLRGLDPSLPVHSLKDVIRFDEAHPREMLRYGHSMLLAGQAAGGVKSTAYQNARTEDLRLAKGGLDTVFSKHRLDALVFPSGLGVAVGAKAGFPSITVPAGYAEDGMPVGLTFLGRAWSESVLIRLAFSFERASQARKRPPL